MGVIDACLYVTDTGGVELAPLRVREPLLPDHVPVAVPSSAASTTPTPATDNTAPEDLTRPNVIIPLIY